MGDDVFSNQLSPKRRKRMPTETTKKLFTVDEYYRMAEAGILPERPRTELINGEIIEVSPMGSLHAAVVSGVTDVFVPLFKGKALLRPQLPLRINKYNEPEPDIVLLNPRTDRYSLRHPGPSDVFLVIEIAATSLKYDRDVKLPIYAEFQLPEVWIADLSEHVLLVYRDPAGKSYKTALQFRVGDRLCCLAFPEIGVEVSEILGQ
jgi:Uma2 family endonuclease